MLLYGAFSLKVSATTCYSPGGNTIVNLNYQPCYTNETGPCCGASDVCLSNGMCFNDGANNLVSQSGCTDPTFNAPGCAIICSGPFCIFSLCVLPVVTFCVKAGLCDCADVNKPALLEVTFTLVRRPDRVGNRWIIAVVIIAVPLVLQLSQYPWVALYVEA